MELSRRVLFIYTITLVQYVVISRTSPQDGTNASVSGIDTTVSTNNTPKTTMKPECPSYHQHSNSSTVCHYVKTLSSCNVDEGYFSYIQFIMCNFSPKYRPASYVILFFWLLYMFLGLGLTAEEFFCPCLKTISKVLHMSDSLAGVTLLALGNGAPDIFSVIAAINTNDSRTAELAFQELFGAGILVMTVVAGSIHLLPSFKVARRPFFRDSVFYLAAVAWTFVIIYHQSIKTAESAGFIVLYLIYVSIVIVGQFVNRRMRSRSLKRLDTVHENEENDDPSAITSASRPPHPPHRVIRDINESADFSAFDHTADVAHLFKENRHAENVEISAVNFQYKEFDENMLSGFIRPTNFFERLTGIRAVDWKCQRWYSKFYSIVRVPLVFLLCLTCPLVDHDVQGQRWDKWLSVWHCLVSPMFCAVTMGVAFKSIYGVFLVWHLVLMLGAILALVVFWVTSPHTVPRFHAAFALLGFLVAVMWVETTAQEVVNLLKTFGWVTGLSYGIMGLTFLAWGNSIGDFISNLTVARNGAPRMAIAACYGGLLNMLLGIGISCTLYAIRHQGSKTFIGESTQYILSAIFLGAAVLASMVFVPINKFKSSRYIGIGLLCLYGIYILMSILHELKILTINGK